MMYIATANFQNLGRFFPTRLSIKVFIALLLSAVVSALFFINNFSPRMPLVVANNLDRWITIDQVTHRSYFRHNFFLNDVVDNAWLQIATNDYSLYVNGVKVGSNNYSINASHAFTAKLRASSQSFVHNMQFATARAPELQRRANKEEKYAHYYDLTPYLKIGENTIALQLQADQQPRFSIYGEIKSNVDSQTISASPNDWKTSLLANPDDSMIEWTLPEYNDYGWVTAIEYQGTSSQVYALDAESIWRQTFNPDAIILNSSPGGDRIRFDLPSQSEFSASVESISWIRIQSSSAYHVFIDDFLLGKGAKNSILAFDVSSFLNGDTRQISIVTIPATDSITSINWLKVDASIQGNHLYSLGDVYSYEGNDYKWLSQKADASSLWSPLNYSYIENIQVPRNFVSRKVNSWHGSIVFFSVVISIFLIFSFVFIVIYTFKKTSPSAQGVYLWYLSLIIFIFSVIEILRYRFFESDTILFYLLPYSSLFFLTILVFLVLMFSSLYFIAKSKSLYTISNSDLFYFLNKDIFYTLSLFLVVVAGVFLRINDIGLEDLQADENVSWDAARGILRTGAPEAASGVLYTRSPLYHYLLAAWLWLMGDNIIMARLFSVIPAIGVIVLSFKTVKLVTKNRMLALVTAMFFSFDSWEIQIAHIIRFYQQMQFFSMLSAYLFIKGFIWNKGRIYQYAFFFSCAAAGTSQEVFVIVFPAYAIAFVLFYKKFNWRTDKYLIVGFLTTMFIIILDIYIFSVTCLTAHVSVATTSGSILQLHLSKILGFVNTFFVGNNRANIIFSLLAIVGFGYWIRRKSKVVFLFYLLVSLTVVTATVLVMQIAGRYLIAIYPFIIFLGIFTVYYGLIALSKFLFSFTCSLGMEKNKAKAFQFSWFRVVLLISAIAGFLQLELWRTFDSYGHPRFPQHLTALEYIQKKKEQSDRILSVHPMPAAIVFNGIDFYLMDKVYFDELYVVDRGAVDRWSGGVLVSSVDKVREIFLRNERVWIVLDELEMRNLSQELQDFLHKSTTREVEFFGVDVLLWERNAGKLPLVIDRGASYNLF